MKDKIVIILGRFVCKIYFAETRTDDDAVREMLREIRVGILQIIKNLNTYEDNSWKRYLPDITQILANCYRIAKSMSELRDILSIFYLQLGSNIYGLQYNYWESFEDGSHHRWAKANRCS